MPPQALTWPNGLTTVEVDTGAVVVIDAVGDATALTPAAVAAVEEHLAHRRRRASGGLPPFIVESWRKDGTLLEGDALTNTFDAFVRDGELGKLFADRYGVVLGRDGDRLYARRYTGGTNGAAEVPTEPTQPAYDPRGDDPAVKLAAGQVPGEASWLRNPREPYPPVAAAPAAAPVADFDVDDIPF